MKVFPSNYMVSQFKNVETLSIAHCDSLEEVFNFEAVANSTQLKVPTELKSLELTDLPNLKRIWNADAVKFLSFPMFVR